MTQSVPPRGEIPRQYTWDVESIFSSDGEWDQAFQGVSNELPGLARFAGHLGEGPDALAGWFEVSADLMRRLSHLFVYASMRYNVDTGVAEAKSLVDRATGLAAQAAAAAAFAEPELIALGFDRVREWIAQDERLSIYGHYIDRLEQRQPHVLSTDVEQVLGLVRQPFSTAAGTHRVLANADLQFAPATSSTGEELDVAQGNINALLTDPDRETRRTAWESYSDGHLSMRNTMANALSAGVQQDVFTARVRKYSSSLEAALQPNFIPEEVFHTLIEVYRKHLPTWHRYWRLRREALGYESLHVYDVKAPLTREPVTVSYAEAVDWIADGMQPLGSEYVAALRRGCLEDRWVDVYPNQRKTMGAHSTGAQGTRPFILMSYNDDLFSMSTLAHELGHSMHSYHAWLSQPQVYARYGLFVAEVASNFNQSMVRAHLLERNPDPDFQIEVIEEAMSNFHRYFFVMPALARFELEIHERVERGQALPADDLVRLMADLFAEGYGDEVEMDVDRIGITWAEFPTHLYSNFYVYQYATGISAANALAHGIIEEGEQAASRYLDFLRAGGSMYPLDALRLAGVDMTSPEPIERAFGVLAGYVDRLGELMKERTPVTA